jgi:hypothetical protein
MNPLEQQEISIYFYIIRCSTSSYPLHSDREWEAILSVRELLGVAPIYVCPIEMGNVISCQINIQRYNILKLMQRIDDNIYEGDDIIYLSDGEFQVRNFRIMDFWSMVSIPFNIDDWREFAVRSSYYDGE